MSMKQLLSQRGQANIKDLPLLVHAHFLAQADPFDAQKNPSGYINLGTAENRLMDGPMLKLLGSIQKDFIWQGEYIHYEKFHGSQEFREAIAAYWQNVFFRPNSTRKLKADQIISACGCSLVLEMLAIALSDPGQVILIPRPFYPGFIHDLESRAECVHVGVDCGLDLNKTAFDEALQEQKRLGRTVRAVLFSSPNNPTGHVYSETAINNLIAFCMENNLDIMSDEIYAQTIYAPESRWVSTLELVPDNFLHRVHVSAGFAKDFALSGFKVGFCHSFNPYVTLCLQELSYFSPVSTLTQALLTRLLQSPRLPGIIQESCTELLKSYQQITGILHGFGISSIPAQGGIFLMADFSRFLQEPSFEAEEELRNFIFSELKVSISPGRIFESNPGMFRLCFAQPPENIAALQGRFAKLKKYH